MFTFIPCEIWTTPFNRYLLITKGIDKVDYDLIQDTFTILFYSPSYLFINYEKEKNNINKLGMQNIHFQIISDKREDGMDDEDWRITNQIKRYLYGYN